MNFEFIDLETLVPVRGKKQCHLARCSRKCSICNWFFSKVPKKLFMRQSSKKRVYEINGLKE